jgi:uncharacterized protein
MPINDLSSALVILAALFLGGLLKGATGAGAPVVAVPVMAAFFDVRLAVIIMVIPNLASNLWQLRRYRAHHLAGGFALRLAGAGAAGAAIGTVLLATLPVAALTLLLAGVIILYIALRLVMPQFRLSLAAARCVVLPLGLAGGVLQGAGGISAPISVSLLNAMRLERPVFIATISAFFAAMSAVQLPLLVGYGLMTPVLLALSGAALAALFAGMPVGAWLAQRLSARAFDRVVLGLLCVLAARLIYVALA